MRHYPVAVLMALLAGCNTSTHVVTGTERPPTDPASVIVYDTPPAHYDTIARVTADSQGSWSMTAQGEMDDAVKALKAEAAKLGANGVILGGVTDETGAVVTISPGLAAPVKYKALTGTAVWVAPAAKP